MRPPLSNVRPVVALLSLASMLAVHGACKRGKIDGTSQESPSGDQIQVTEAGVTIASSAGTVMLTGGVPSDFPKSIPIYPGARVTMAHRSPATQSKPAWSLALETVDDPEQVVAFYRVKLSSFTRATDQVLGDNHMAIWQSSELDVTLLAAKAPDQDTSISMTVSGK
jgi:hypothetical protein